MLNIEYQTQSNIQIECWISNIKLNPTFKSNIEYRISNSISHSNFEFRISNIKLNPTFDFFISNLDLKSQIEISRVLIIKLNPTSKFWIDCYIVPFVKHCPSMRQGWWFTLFSLWIIGHTLKARLQSVGWCMMLICSWAQRGSSWGFL